MGKTLNINKKNKTHALTHAHTHTDGVSVISDLSTSAVRNKKKLCIYDFVLNYDLFHYSLTQIQGTFCCYSVVRHAVL